MGRVARRDAKLSDRCQALWVRDTAYHTCGERCGRRANYTAYVDRVQWRVCGYHARLTAAAFREMEFLLFQVGVRKDASSEAHGGLPDSAATPV